MKSLQLLYHEIRTEPSRYSYVIESSAFEEHCRLFAGVQHEAPETLLRPEVTFDDGHISNLTHAAPVLGAHRLHARFFITAGWTGKKIGFMSWPQLRELHAEGYSIGAHGLTHTLLTACSDRELAVELDRSRKLLEDGLGIRITTMSLPGGRADIRVLRACRGAGYTQVFTSTPRAEEAGAVPFTVGRLNLLGATTVSWLREVLQPESGLLAKLERNDRLKGAVKRLLGDRVYARLWAIGNRQEPEPDEAVTQ